MNKYLFDGKDIAQPLTPVKEDWETTYTPDSGRVMSGNAILDPMFTVESFGLEFANLTPEQVSELLQVVVPRASKNTFSFTYYSPYYGKWRTDEFYTGKGTLNIRRAKDDDTRYERISFNVIGVNPIT